MGHLGITDRDAPGGSLLPPWGIIIGGIAGGLLGELIAGKETGKALQASWGIFVGYMVSTGLKLLFCSVLLSFYLKEMF